MPAPPSVPPGLSPQLICVCDPSAEADHYVQALSAHGYTVKVVEHSALLERAHEAMPALLVCDVDAPGALALIRQMRNLPDATALEVLAVGTPGQTLTQQAEAVALETSGQFPRPVNPAMLVLTVETLVGGPPPEFAAVSDAQPSLASSSIPPGSIQEQAPPQDHLQISDSLSELLRLSEEHVAANLHREPEIALDQGAPEPDLIPLEALEVLAARLPDPDDNAADPAQARTGQASDTATGAPGDAPESEAPLTQRATVPPPRRQSDHSQTGNFAPPKPLSSIPLNPEASRASSAPPNAGRSASIVPLPRRLHEGEPLFAVGSAVRQRFTGALAFESATGVYRLLLQEGDFVTALSSDAEESLVHFLVHSGQLQPQEAMDLAPKLPVSGRHTGTALIARGKLPQSELWPTLRAHAEWLLGRMLTLSAGTVQSELDLPQRLVGEPTVFGGATGAEILIEVVRRVVEPKTALRWLGGARAMVNSKPDRKLLVECALTSEELESVEVALGTPLNEAMGRSELSDLPTLLVALQALGVITTTRSSNEQNAEETLTPPPSEGNLNSAALRARVAARKALVDEADYFTLLGVSPAATAYDIRRAYTTLRQQFEPGRILTGHTADLADTVMEITEMLDEAYAILANDDQRQAYRKALLRD